MTRTYNNTVTRLMQFVFVAMLIFAGLTTTGCGLVDSNEPDEITFERTLTLEPEITYEIFDGAASTDGQTARYDPFAGLPEITKDFRFGRPPMPVITKDPRFLGPPVPVGKLYR